MKIIYQTGGLLFFLLINCAQLMAQGTGKLAVINSPGKKSSMQVVFIDRFVVPNTAKAEF